MEQLHAKRAELVRKVEAIDEVIRSKGWQVLRNEFEERRVYLEGQLLAESKNPKIDVDKLHFLQGQMNEVNRFDLPSWGEKLKKELEGIKANLNE